jgi:type I restriction enzyme S subunit
MNNISSDGQLDFSLVRRIPKNIAENTAKWLEPGDVIFCNTNSTELVGKSCLFSGWNEKCTYSNHLTRLRANHKHVIPQWLLLSLRQLWLEGYFATNCTEFIGQSAFNKDKLCGVEIPIPPLPEQQRIVARIDELTKRLDHARKLRKETAISVEALIPATMAKCFTPDENWIEDSLGNLCAMKTGKTPPTKHPAYFEGTIPFVCPADLGITLQIQSAERSISEKAVADNKAVLFNPGTVLLVCIGSTVGKVGLATIPLCTNQQITGLVFNKDIIPEYAAWYLSLQKEVIRNAAAGGGVPIINQNGVAQLPFQYPKDKTTQRRIVDYLNGLRDKADQLKKHQAEVDAELDSFLPALLAKAFRGEL